MKCVSYDCGYESEHDFETQDGKYICPECNGENGTETIAHTERTNFQITREIRIKKPKLSVTKQNVIPSVNWSTNDGFNCVIREQISDIKQIITDFQDDNNKFENRVLDVWENYKIAYELLTCHDTSDGSPQIHGKLQPHSRTRDLDIWNREKSQLSTKPRKNGAKLTKKRLCDDEIDGNDANSELNESNANPKRKRIEINQQMVTNHLSDNSKRNLESREYDYLSKSRNINSKYFNDLTVLPKTIAMINIALRFIKSNVYLSDIIRWINQYYVTYYCSLNVLPEHWNVIASDFKTFTSNTSPSPNNISIHSAKIARIIGYNRESLKLNSQNFETLIERFVYDLNLPESFVQILIENFYLQSIVEKNYCLKSNAESLEHYDRFALIFIIMSLRYVFDFDHEFKEEFKQDFRRKSKHHNVFSVENWLMYCRVLMKKIEEYSSIPYNTHCAHNYSDLSVYVKRVSDFVKIVPRKVKSVRVNKSRNEQNREFLSNILSQLYPQYNERIDNIELPKPSLHPLTDSVKFIKKFEKNPNYVKIISNNYRKNLIMEIKGKRKYVKININDSKPNFNFLLELCSKLLYCDKKDFYPIIKSIDNWMSSRL